MPLSFVFHVRSPVCCVFKSVLKGRGGNSFGRLDTGARPSFTPIPVSLPQHLSRADKMFSSARPLPWIRANIPLGTPRGVLRVSLCTRCSMLVMRLPIRLAWKWSTKKRVPESMPTSEALGKPVLNTWENAPLGRALLIGSIQGNQGLAKETTPENFLGFPKWRRLAVYAKSCFSKSKRCRLWFPLFRG